MGCHYKQVVTVSAIFTIGEVACAQGFKVASGTSDGKFNIRDTAALKYIVVNIRDRDTIYHSANVNILDFVGNDISCALI